MATTRLSDIKKGSKIYENVDIGGKTIEGSYIVFDHLDGLYSYCETYDKEGDLLMDGDHPAIVHLHRRTPLVPFEDGYKIGREE